MRLAVIADIHGNLAALEAVIADIAERRVDAVIDLSDCVSGPLWPRETLALLRERGWPTVRGNHDRWVGTGHPAPLSDTDAFAAEAVGPAGRAWLAALPPRLDLGPGPGITGFHARPDDDNAYLLEDIHDGRFIEARPATVAARLAGVSAPLILHAHSHRAALLRLPDGRWILNPGSVGCPAYDDPTPSAHVSESGSPAARYAVVDIEDAGPDGARIELLAIPYDHLSAVRRALACDRGDWAGVLSSGYAGVR